MMTNRSFSRRGFLKAAAGVGVGIPLLQPGSIWSAESSPSGKITVGAIGLGGMGSGNLDGFLGDSRCRVLRSATWTGQPGLRALTLKIATEPGLRRIQGLSGLNAATL